MFVLILLFFLVFVSPTLAAPPPNFQSTPVVTTGLEGPSGFEIAPDGRIFILERTGEIKVVKEGKLLPEPFAVLPSVASGDRGLIGIAFDPDFLNNHYVYFYYTGTDLLNRLVRFNASGNIGTEGPLIIYQTSFPSEQLHVGGTIRFGPDGKMYFGVGDNGYPPNGQDLSNPHGKIIRINKDGSIPQDNPFVGTANVLPEIWAYGFRNPWRFQFDKASGKLYSGDVGEATWEEMNLITKGGNYGWPRSEGQCLENCQGLINPLYTYNHDNLSSAITAGPIYRGSQFPSEFTNNIFIGDYARGFIRRLVLNQSGDEVIAVHDFDTNAGSVVDIKEAGDGSLYYITYIPGALYKITYSTGNHYPIANASANVTKGVEPLTVNFSSTGSYDPDNDPLSFHWDFGDGTTSTAQHPTKTYSQKGKFIAQLAVSDSSGSAVSVPIVIQVGIPPALEIASPIDGQLFSAGEEIFYTAHAIDAAGFDINEGAFTTEIVFHHGTHIHPFLGPFISKTGSFKIPVSGEVSADIWYEVKITATDTSGLSTTKSVNIRPRIVNWQLNSNPSGLKILLNGIPTETDQIIPTVVGYHHEVKPFDNQPLDNNLYQFDHWSDNQSTVHTVIVPTTNFELTAHYRVMPAFKGEYFGNTQLLGTPIIVRQDQSINFLWSETTPDAKLKSDEYSVRWTKNQYFAYGRYKFSTTTDDGVRLFIDDTLVIDQWHDQGNTTYSHIADFNAGEHSIKMEYYEAFGGATAQLFWELTPDQPTVHPTPTPTPTPSPTSPPNQNEQELLTSAWNFSTSMSGSTEQYQAISQSILNGKAILSLTYNLHGHCIFDGDASAIIFDQGGEWRYISLSKYGQNCFNGNQTISIPLTDFSGLVTTQPVGTFHGRFWGPDAYTITVSSAKLLSSTSPSPTPTPSPSGLELLLSPWKLTAPSGTSETYQQIPADSLKGMDSITLTYNLHGLCALGGDASAIIFDQGGAWRYVSLSNYGENCLNEDQTVSIPLSDFPGLDLNLPVGMFHSRFWNQTAYSVDIKSAVLSTTSSPPPPQGSELLSSRWTLSAANGSAEAFQAINPSIFNGKTTLSLTYNLHGFCALDGDASAIIFDQGGEWRYISLSKYGQNCKDGEQTVSIPLSDFSGLTTSAPVGTFHARFWYWEQFNVEVISAQVN